MLQQKIVFVFILTLIIVIGKVGNTAVINASNCSRDYVQAAIDSAQPGDIVNIPSGSCTWGAGVSIPDSKKITLQGQGYKNTIITRSGTAITMNESGARVTGFGFILPGGIGPIINVSGTGWRIDHCRFNNTTGSSQLSIQSDARNRDILPTGLIDSNEFINGRINVDGLFTLQKGSNVWGTSLRLGSENAVYIEDNVAIRTDGLVNRNIVDAHRSGNYVFRFNNITDTYCEAHSLQGTTERGTRSWEIYRNTIKTNLLSVYQPIFLRSGTGLVFDNTIYGFQSNYVAFDNRRALETFDIGLCNGTNSWDGNNNSTGWLCRDQIGVGADLWVWSGSGNLPTQEKYPAYVFRNHNNSGTLLDVDIRNSSGDHIKINRDFYRDASGFNGNSGVGSGTLANRPSTCTTGVGYWATDQGNWNKNGSGGQGVLYKCTSTNKWELYYTPYEYPHPLRNAPPESGDLTQPKIINIEPV